MSSNAKKRKTANNTISTTAKVRSAMGAPPGILPPHPERQLPTLDPKGPCGLVPHGLGREYDSGRCERPLLSAARLREGGRHASPGDAARSASNRPNRVPDQKSGVFASGWGNRFWLKKSLLFSEQTVSSIAPSALNHRRVMVSGALNVSGSSTV